MLGDVTETVYVWDDEDEDNVRAVKKQSEMLVSLGKQGAVNNETNIHERALANVAFSLRMDIRALALIHPFSFH